MRNYIEWVRKEDRSPKDGEVVIITMDDGAVLTWIYNGGEVWDSHVIAWAELPAPYKETTQGANDWRLP